MVNVVAKERNHESQEFLQTINKVVIWSNVRLKLTCIEAVIRRLLILSSKGFKFKTIRQSSDSNEYSEGEWNDRRLFSC